jgi:PEP-CTERM motif
MERGMLRTSALMLLTSAGIISGGAAPASAQSYQTLGNPADPSFNQLLGINDADTIAGYFGDGSVVPNNGYTFNPASHVFTAENFPGAVQTQVTGINNTPITVGFYVDQSGDNIGFVSNGTKFISVADPLTPTTGPTVNQLLGVNDSGIAAGFYTDAAGNNHGYLYSIATAAFEPVTLPTTFGAISTTVTDVNDLGTISGYFTNATGTFSFLYLMGTYYALQDPYGTDTMIFGINNNDEAVGSYVNGSGETEGFFFNPVGAHWLTISDPSASATAAFGVDGTTVNGLNDNGDLVGFYSDGTNVDGMFVQIAPERSVGTQSVPEPSTWVMMLLGFAGLGFVGHRTSRKAISTAA